MTASYPTASASRVSRPKRQPLSAERKLERARKFNLFWMSLSLALAISLWLNSKSGHSFALDHASSDSPTLFAISQFIYFAEKVGAGAITLLILSIGSVFVIGLYTLCAGARRSYAVKRASKPHAQE